MGPTVVVESLLHPARLRIAQALAGRTMTVDELDAAVSEVPKSSIYRHLRRLTADGAVEVVAERPSRGGVKRSYRLVEGSARLSMEDATDISMADLSRYFTALIGSLLGDWDRYQQGATDPVSDRVTFAQVPIHLDADRFPEFMTRLRAVVEDFRTGPATRRMVTLIVLPTADSLLGSDDSE